MKQNIENFNKYYLEDGKVYTTEGHPMHVNKGAKGSNDYYILIDNDGVKRKVDVNIEPAEDVYYWIEGFKNIYAISEDRKHVFSMYIGEEISKGNNKLKLRKNKMLEITITKQDVTLDYSVELTVDDLHEKYAIIWGYNILKEECEKCLEQIKKHRLLIGVLDSDIQKSSVVSAERVLEHKDCSYMTKSICIISEAKKEELKKLEYYEEVMNAYKARMKAVKRDYPDLFTEK